jgi:hypothetical protein
MGYWVGPQSRSRRCEEKNLLLVQGIDPGFLGSPVSIVTEILRVRTRRRNICQNTNPGLSVRIPEYEISRTLKSLNPTTIKRAYRSCIFITELNNETGRPVFCDTAYRISSGFLYTPWSLFADSEWVWLTVNFDIKPSLKRVHYSWICPTKFSGNSTNIYKTEKNK